MHNLDFRKSTLLSVPFKPQKNVQMSSSDNLLASSSYPSSFLTPQSTTFRQTLLSLCQWLLSLPSYLLPPWYCNHLSDELLFPLGNTCWSFTLTGSFLLKLSPSYEYPGCYTFHVQTQRLLYTVSIQLHVVFCVLGQGEGGTQCGLGHNFSISMYVNKRLQVLIQITGFSWMSNGSANNASYFACVSMLQVNSSFHVFIYKPKNSRGSYQYLLFFQ